MAHFEPEQGGQNADSTHHGDSATTTAAEERSERYSGSHRPTPKEYVPEGGFAKPAVVVCSYSITIEAPASHAFHLTTHPSTWPQWNSFAPTCNVDAVAPDTRMTMQVVIDPARPTRQSSVHLKVVAAGETAMGYAVRWDLAGPFSFLMRADRTQEFVDLGAGRCEYRTTEYMNGLYAYVVKFLHESTIRARMLDWCNDLRNHAETTWQQKQTHHEAA